MRPKAHALVLSVSVLLMVLALLARGPARAAAAGSGTLVVNNGDPGKRITLVLLGDGYTAADLPRFREQAAAVWQALTEVEPFRTYQHFFDVRRVDVVSPQSGLHRGSPLGMHFGCDGIARLLCADDSAVAGHAGEPSGPQYTLALADSTEYGGEGGGATTTLAAGSPDAAQIIQHEMGHTVGALGDEYDSAPADSSYPNLSSKGAGAMRADRVKWWRWLGAADPSGGTVGAYRSGNGLYRPTKDSIMRTLGGVYNLPSREAIIESVYRQVSPVDHVAPAAGTVAGLPKLQVFPLALAGGRRLQVSWRVDGRPAPAAAVSGDTLDPTRLGIGPGRTCTVAVTVRDTTPWVRDEAFRAGSMTRTVTWSLRG
ncbi:M64 family metallopeptidase [Streptacidiphilus carbonis]|uniref:M64 family metallopeptidase n=1 Tax=Streptacidiphilus carbonis TaxID=105422 RepID=UPI0005A723B6|nr:M64 family metallopeptidase [Streptacidiphilus carbonis]